MKYGFRSREVQKSELLKMMVIVNLLKGILPTILSLKKWFIILQFITYLLQTAVQNMLTSVMLQNTFSQEDILLLSFQTLKIYLRALTRRLDAP